MLQRDRYAELLSVIAITGCSLEKFATEVRGLQTKLREVEGAVRAGQGFFRHAAQRNPINCEKVCGLSACCGYARWRRWRTWRSGMSATSAILPSSASSCRTRPSCWITALVLMTRILGDLFVYPENMLRSMSMSYGLPNFSTCC